MMRHPNMLRFVKRELLELPAFDGPHPWVGSQCGLSPRSTDGMPRTILQTFPRACWFTLLLALTGCGADAGSLDVASAEGVKPSATVNFYTWATYTPPDMLPAFTTATGIAVNSDFFDSNDVLEGKLLAGNTGYDVVVPTASRFSNQRSAGLYLPLDRTKLTNWGNLDPQILDKVAAFDPDHTYAVPFTLGTTGLGVNLTMIRERLPDAPLDSWRLLFDPEIVRHFQDCGVTMLDSAEDLAVIGLIYLGYPPDSSDLAELREAMELVARIRPYIRYFHSSQYIDDFANGEVCLVLGWSGDLNQAIGHAREGLELTYILPKEGSVLWFDLLAIPADAPHPAEAHRLIDYLMTPEVAAGFTNTTFYPSGNRAALQFVNPAIRNDPAVYPPRELMGRLFSTHVHEPVYVRKLNRFWTTVKSG